MKWYTRCKIAIYRNHDAGTAIRKSGDLPELTAPGWQPCWVTEPCNLFFISNIYVLNMSFSIMPNKLLMCFYFLIFHRPKSPLWQAKKVRTIPWKKKKTVILVQLTLKSWIRSSDEIYQNRKAKNETFMSKYSNDEAMFTFDILFLNVFTNSRDVE